MNESAIQRQIVDFVSALGIIVHAIPNRPESRRVVGYRAGVADLLMWPGGRGVYVEVKQPGGALSDEQRIFSAGCKTAGIPYYVCRSVEDVAEVLKTEGIQ